MSGTVGGLTQSRKYIVDFKEIHLKCSVILSRYMGPEAYANNYTTLIMKMVDDFISPSVNTDISDIYIEIDNFILEVGDLDEEICRDIASEINTMLLGHLGFITQMTAGYISATVSEERLIIEIWT